MSTIAVVVAAGRGRRFAGDEPKQYADLGGVTVLRRCLDSLLAHPAVDAVQVVIHPADRELYHRAVDGLDLLPPVDGGADRQDSVRLGLEARRISHQHEQINKFYGLVAEAVRGGAPAEARDAFRHFHDALEAHFAVEERTHFPALHGMDPETDGELAALVREHHEFRRRLAALEELRDYERRVAILNFGLAEEIFDPVEERIQKELFARDVK